MKILNMNFILYQQI